MLVSSSTDRDLIILVPLDLLIYLHNVSYYLSPFGFVKTLARAKDNSVVATSFSCRDRSRNAIRKRRNEAAAKSGHKQGIRLTCPPH